SGRRWLHLSAGLLVGWGGYIYFLTTVYCPQVIGSETPMIKNGITVDFVATCIGVPILYFTSKLNSPQRPNLLRWLVFFIAVFFANCVLSSSFILIWAVPVQPLTTYPYWAALVTIVTIPYCLLILGLAKDFVPPKVNNVGDTASPPPPL
ncbi:MAG: hypothetical protein SWE60_26250, partial [Thermodesulfobacteriota bacterium]|nr:hypothetical protein [Thermodesulfobacteriota bacterium]